MDAIRVNPPDGGTIIEFTPLTSDPTGPERGDKAFLYFLKNAGYRLKRFGQASEPLTEAETGTVFDPQPTDPPAITGKGQVYTKVSGGQVQLFYITDTGTIYQLTPLDFTPFIRKDGTVAFISDQPLGGHKLTGVGNPLSAQDAATKTYTDAGDAATLASAEAYTLAHTGAGTDTTAYHSTDGTLTPSADGSQSLGTASRRLLQIMAEFYRVFKGAGDANASAQLQDGALLFGPGGSGGQDCQIKRTAPSTIAMDGNGGPAAILDMETGTIINVTDPVVAQGVATKNYVDVNTFGRSDTLLQKSFFSAQGLLPTGIIREDLFTFPAPDWSNLASGTLVRSMSRGRFTASGNPANLGWNLGGTKSKVLFILGGMRAISGFSIGIAVGTAANPASANLPQGYAGAFDFNSSRVDIFKGDGAGTNTFLPPAESTINPINTSQAGNLAMAIYVDGGSGRIVLFVKFGGEQWFPVVDITDGTYASFQTVAIQMFPAGVNWFICPMGIYAQ